MCTDGSTVVYPGGAAAYVEGITVPVVNQPSVLALSIDCGGDMYIVPPYVVA